MKKRLDFQGHDVFLIPSSEGTYLLYAPTLKKLFRVGNTLALDVAKMGFDTGSSCRDIGVVSANLDRSVRSAAVPFPVHEQTSKFFHLALGLTRNCTLGCLYCHADAGAREDMPPEIMRSAIQNAFETSKIKHLKGIRISFAVGGEPTTNWTLFKLCVATIRESQTHYGLPVHLSMTTNGYYGDHKRSFIARHLNSVLISLDGPPEIQDLHRPSKTGKPTYSIVRESAIFFLRNAKSFSIRSTVSNRSVSMMPTIVEFFHKEFGNGFDLVFEPLVPLGRALTNVIAVSEPNQEDFVRYYIQAKELGQKLGLQVRTSAASQRRLVTAFCGAMSIPSFTVTTRGVVTTCERDSDGNSYWYGRFSPESADFVLDERRIERNTALVGMPTECADCFCKWHCAGDCPDIRSLGYDRCYVNMNLVKKELESIVASPSNGTARGGAENEERTCFGTPSSQGTNKNPGGGGPIL